MRSLTLQKLSQLFQELAYLERRAEIQRKKLKSFISADSLFHKFSNKSSFCIHLPDFVSRTKLLTSQFNDEEIEILYNCIDRNCDRIVSYLDFMQFLGESPNINQTLKKQDLKLIKDTFETDEYKEHLVRLFEIELAGANILRINAQSTLEYSNNQPNLLFQYVDIWGKGYLNCNDFDELIGHNLPKEDANRIIQRLQSGANGQVTQKEFVHFFEHYRLMKSIDPTWGGSDSIYYSVESRKNMYKSRSDRKNSSNKDNTYDRIMLKTRTTDSKLKRRSETADEISFITEKLSSYQENTPKIVRKLYSDLRSEQSPLSQSISNLASVFLRTTTNSVGRILKFESTFNKDDNPKSTSILVSDSKISSLKQDLQKRPDFSLICLFELMKRGDKSIISKKRLEYFFGAFSLRMPTESSTLLIAKFDKDYKGGIDFEDLSTMLRLEGQLPYKTSSVMRYQDFSMITRKAIEMLFHEIYNFEAIKENTVQSTSK